MMNSAFKQTVRFLTGESGGVHEDLKGQKIRLGASL
jgi:hypothetical protein